MGTTVVVWVVASVAEAAVSVVEAAASAEAVHPDNKQEDRCVAPVLFLPGYYRSSTSCTGRLPSAGMPV